MSAFDPEQAVLGAILLAPECYWSVAELLTDADFAQASNRRMFLAIREQLGQGKPCDAVTLGEDYPDLSSYAITLASTTPGSSNVLAYAGIVKRDAERERVRQAGKRIALADGYDEALALLDAVRPKQTAKVKTAKDGLREMVEAMTRRYDEGEVSGVPTGLAGLDALTGGWQPGQLIVVAGRPGTGKSAYMVQACVAAGRSIITSLEMTAGEITERLVAHMGRVPLSWIRQPMTAPDHSGSRIVEASRPVSGLPILLDDSTGLTVEAICSRARQAHMQEPLRLIVVDHLGLISRPGRNDAAELGQVTSALKRLAKDLAVPVMLLAQLNRQLEQRQCKRPLLSDLRDSGRIEEDADIVIGMYRERSNNPDADNLAEFNLLKNRSGERGIAWATADLGVMRFEPAEPRERPAEEAASPQRARGFAPRGYAGGKQATVSRLERSNGSD